MKYGHGSLAWVGTFWSAVLSCADRIDVQITGMHETYSSSFSYFVGEWYSVWSVSVPTASHHDLGSTGFTELNRDLAQLKPRQMVAYTAAHASGSEAHHRRPLSHLARERRRWGFCREILHDSRIA